jgi:hypothetical protein
MRQSSWNESKNKIYVKKPSVFQDFNFVFLGMSGKTSDRKDVLRQSYRVIYKILTLLLLYGRNMTRVSKPSMDLGTLYILYHHNVVLSTKILFKIHPHITVFYLHLLFFLSSFLGSLSCDLCSVNNTWTKILQHQKLYWTVNSEWFF